MKFSNKTILWVLTLMNVLNFIDRGIIPGATNEFTEFIEASGIHHEESVYLGLLQSAFIVGYAISSGIFGHMVHYYPPFKICLIGMTIWTIAVTLSGLSFYSRQYTFLFLSRMLSGVAEASFQCSIPPWIAKYSAPEEKGTWMSIFFTAIPVGTAIGYAYSAALAETIGWQFSFFFEGAVMLLFFPFLIKINPHFAVEGHESRRGSKDFTHGDQNAEVPSIVDEFRSLFSSSVYILVVAGYAMQTGAVIGVSTFGSAFLMGLGYFNTETESSTVFGIMVSIAGVIATPLGGIVLDKLAASYIDQKNARLQDQRGNNGNGGENSATEKINREIQNITGHMDNSNIQGTDEEDDEEIVVPTIDTEKERATLHSALVVITLVSIVGGVFLCLDYLVYNKVLFTLMIGMGCFFIFMTYSGITMAIMLSVPMQNRAFAMGISTLCIHVFGDVPSPIITGFIKDKLAPGCAGGSSDSSSVATSDACRADNQGLRQTMLILTLLLILTVIFFAVAWAEEIRIHRKQRHPSGVSDTTTRLLQSDVFDNYDDDEESPLADRQYQPDPVSPPSPLQQLVGNQVNLRRPQTLAASQQPPKPLSSAPDTEVSFVVNPMSRTASSDGGGSPHSKIPKLPAAPAVGVADDISDATLSLLDAGLDEDGETEIYSVGASGSNSQAHSFTNPNPMMMTDRDSLDTDAVRKCV